MGRLRRDKRAPGVVEWREVYGDGTCWDNMRDLMVQYVVGVAAAEEEAAAAMGGDDRGGAPGQARGRSEIRGGEEEGLDGRRFHRSFSPE